VALSIKTISTTSISFPAISGKKSDGFQGVRKSLRGRFAIVGVVARSRRSLDLVRWEILTSKPNQRRIHKKCL
jgi:hypothetical protein